MIGAVVGVQPFGGQGLSGTGPKAGGPLYVQRLLSQRPPVEAPSGELVGPVGERNLYTLRPKGTVLCISGDPQQLKVQHDLVRATGNRVAADEGDKDIAAVLFDGSQEDLTALNRRLAERPGRIVSVYLKPYPRDFLFDEVSLSVNTAAAGGNASLMAIG
jgi:RHH-type proline utilization regulon transcriptional repressor/proline dehydrogenase/delta 1-pyrroline-5-carboxylate dehydrogenase